MKKVFSLFVVAFLLVGFMGLAYADKDDSERDPEVELEGTINFLDLEGGCWVFESEGETYEFRGVSEVFLQEGLKVKIEGKIDEGEVSICQIGPIIKVTEIERLDNEDNDREDYLNGSENDEKEREKNKNENEDDENESEEKEREREENKYEEEGEYKYRDANGNEYTYKYKIKVEDDGTIKREVEYKNKSFGSEVELEFFNVTEGNLTMVKFKAKLSNGNQEEVKIMPETASETALDRLRAKNLTIELKEVPIDGENVSLAYEVKAEKEYRVLGIFKTRSRVSALIDAENGEVLEEDFPWWSFLAGEVDSSVDVNNTEN